MKHNHVAAIALLRFSLAFVFLYAAVESFLRPMDWIGYLPQFIRDIAPARPLLAVFSVYEIALAVWIFIGKKGVWAAGLAFLTLLGITMANLAILDITFRDIGLALAALALFDLEREAEGSAGAGGATSSQTQKA